MGQGCIASSIRKNNERGASVIRSDQKALLIAKASLAKKAQEVVILDMRKVSNFTDFFVIASGTSQRQVQAVVDSIEETLSKKGISRWHVEGYQNAQWIVMDYGDIVAHVFLQEKREFYRLERLWAEAPRKYLTDEGVRLEYKRSH
ncbi:MAG: ribosome silencing factor [Candidatus Omnitrophota bacterium]